MKSFRTFAENVIQFGSAKTRYRWTVKKETISANRFGGKKPEPVHSEIVELPKSDGLRHQHMNGLMTKMHDDVSKTFPDHEHTTSFRPGDPVGTNHGTHWVDKEGSNVTHVFTHHFEKLD
jgi:hypothetical protein